MEGHVEVEMTSAEVICTNNPRLSLPDVLTDVRVENAPDSQQVCAEGQLSRLSDNQNVQSVVPTNNRTIHQSPDKHHVSPESEEFGASTEKVIQPPDSSHMQNELVPKELSEDASEQFRVATSEIFEGPTSPKYDFEKPFAAQLITGVWEEFKGGCEEPFTKGCKWSPDGTCILTNSEDKILRIFDLPGALHCQEAWPTGRTLPELRPALRIKEGGRVYDYCWFPFMSSWDPLSCCLVACSQFAPVHLWDAYSGQLRATYRAYNSMDEIEHAFSVAFDLSGQKLYCGFKKRLCVFDTARPGSTCETRILKGLGRPVGIVSCICVNPADERMYAFSSYSRTIGLCSEPGGEVICLLCNEGGGLTHIMFSPDGQRLYAGSRNDCLLFCWDTRMLGRVLFTAERPGATNQRIYFDLTPDGRHLLSGSTDGRVLVWDTQKAPETPLGSEVPSLPLLTTFPAHGDCVNGLSIHKQYPVLATASGQRHPYCPECDSDGEGAPSQKKRHTRREDTLKLWWMGRTALTSPET